LLTWHSDCITAVDGPRYESRCGRVICLFPKTSRPALASRSLQFNGYRNCFMGMKWPVREVDHLPPSDAEVKNYWSLTSVRTGTALP
jgi:hypothetical protein